MNKEPDSRKIPRSGFSLSVFAYFVLLCSYPLLSFLWRRNYPIDSGEVIALFASLLIFSLSLSLVVKSVRAVVMIALTILITVAALLVQFNFRLEGFLILLVFLVFAFWKLGNQAFKLGIPILIAMIFGALIESSNKPGHFEHQQLNQASKGQLPPVVHILLDGFIGTEGLPSNPAASEFKNQVDRFFKDFGFSHFPKTFSRYPYTGDSLYTAMNFKHETDFTFRVEAAERRQHILASNRYFDNLANAGYAFRIYQTSHLDFCRSNFESTEKCWTYSHPNVQTIREVDGLGKRAIMLLKVLSKQSRILTSSTAQYIDDPAIATHDPEALALLEQDLLRSPGGTVFFAHLLIPHNPFVYLNDCSISYEDNPDLSIGMLFDETDKDPEIRNYRTLRYFEQAECALLTLRRVFEKMKTNGIFDDAIIVLHGDHGSAISKTFPNVLTAENLTIEDLKAHYSTLFAMKFPNGKFEEKPQTLSLAPLLEAASLYSSNQIDNIDQFLSKNYAGKPEVTDQYLFIVNGIGYSRINVKLFDQNN